MYRKLMCCAHGRPGQWEAICLDLDIAVSGRSFDEVRASLNKAIEMYIEAACAEDPSAREKLLNRRVPLFTRLRHLAYCAWHVIRSKKRTGDDLYASFDLTCPA